MVEDVLVDVNTTSEPTFCLAARGRCRLCCSGGCSCRIQRLRGEHLWRAVDEVHGVHGRAVLAEEVEAGDVVVFVCVDGEGLFCSAMSVEGV